jgi:hypothetical protein
MSLRIRAKRLVVREITDDDAAEVSCTLRTSACVARPHAGRRRAAHESGAMSSTVGK